MEVEEEEELKPSSKSFEEEPKNKVDCHSLNIDKTLDKGWSWVIMLASFGGFCLIGATMFAVGIVHTALLEAFGASISTTSWACAIHSALLSSAAPLASHIIDHFSCRLVMILSGVLYTLGYFLTAFAPNIYVAVITNGIIAGIGAALGFTSCLVVIGLNFKRYRNIAYGFALSGVGIGMFFFAPLMQWAQSYYGAKGFFIFLAGISANLVTFGMLCTPSGLEISLRRTRKVDIFSHKRQQNSNILNALKVYINVASNKPVLCLCMSLLMHNFCTFIVFMFLPSYVESRGFTKPEASYVVSLTGLTTAIGRLITGFISTSRYIPELVIYCVSMGTVSISTFLLPILSKSLMGNFAFSVLLGLFFANSSVVMSTLTIRYLDIRYLVVATGLQLLFAGIGSLVGPVVAGLIIDGEGSYDHIFILAGSVELLAVAFGAVSKCFHTRRSNTVI